MKKNTDNLKDELRGLSPFLWEQKRQPEGYKVPGDYFRSLADEIIKRPELKPARRQTQPEKSTWWETWAAALHSLRQPRYALAFATVALLLVAGIYYCPPPVATSSLMTKVTLDEVPGEVLEGYISENIDEFEEELLSEELTRSTNNAALPKPELHLTDDELIDELIQNLNIDDIEELF